MDTHSASQVAQRLGTSAPRVLRAIRRLGLSVSRSHSGEFQINQEQEKRLAEDLGVTPATGLSRVQTRILAGLGVAPRGLVSLRAVARRAGVSPSSVRRTLAILIDLGLVTATPTTVAHGRARDVTLYRANVTSPQWPQLAPILAQVKLPVRNRYTPAKIVPYYLRHLFWNVSSSQLDVTTSAPFIARRLLTIGNLDGLAWGVKHLPSSAWEHAARARGLDPKSRALAYNVAEVNRDAT